MITSHHQNGHFRKNPGIHPGYHFYDFYLNNDNLGLTIKVLKFLGIWPIVRSSWSARPTWSDDRLVMNQ